MTNLADKVQDRAAAQQQGTAVEKKTKTVFEVVREMQPQFELALADNIDAAHFTRVAVTLIKNNRALAQADPKSLLGALMISAQLGLELDLQLGQAYLVPFKTKGQKLAQITFIVGYRGYIALAVRSKDIASVKPVAVFEGDEFSWTLGLDETIVHKPTAAVRDDPAKLTHVYAVARFRDKEIAPIFVVLTRAEIEKRRARSRAKDNGPWVTDFIPMALKTGVRALSPWLPMATAVTRANSVDERVVDRIHANVDDFIDADGEEVPPNDVGASAGGDTAGGAPAPEASTATPPAENAADASTFDCDVCQGTGADPDDNAIVCAACKGTKVAS